MKSIWTAKQKRNENEELDELLTIEKIWNIMDCMNPAQEVFLWTYILEELMMMNCLRKHLFSYHCYDYDMYWSTRGK